MSDQNQYEPVARESMLTPKKASHEGTPVVQFEEQPDELREDLQDGEEYEYDVEDDLPELDGARKSFFNAQGSIVLKGNIISHDSDDDNIENIIQSPHQAKDKVTINFTGQAIGMQKSQGSNNDTQSQFFQNQSEFRNTATGFSRDINRTPDVDKGSEHILSYTASTSNEKADFRRVTATSSTSAKSSKKLVEPQNELIDDDNTKKELDQNTRFKYYVFGFTCIGIILSLILILVFLNNAAGNKGLTTLNPTELTANWGIGAGIQAGRPLQVGSIFSQGRPNDNTKLNTGTWSSSPQSNTTQESQVASAGYQIVASNNTLFCEYQFQHFVYTDKPMYKQGDVIFVSSLLVDTKTKIPNTNTSSNLFAKLKIYNGQDKQVYMSLIQEFQNATASFAVKIPYDIPGGVYKLQISSGYKSVFKNSYRSIRVMATQQPTMLLTADFDKPTYVPGDNVTMKIKVKKADSSLLGVGSSISVRYQQNEQTKLSLDRKGEVVVNAKLAKSLSASSFTFSIAVFENFQNFPSFTTQKSITILDESKIKVELHSHQSKVALGLETQGYFQVYNKEKNMLPASFKTAKIMKNGQQVGKVKKLQNGRGKYKYTPTDSDEYILEVQLTTHSIQQALVKADINETIQVQMASNVFPQNQINFNILGKNNKDQQVDIKLYGTSTKPLIQKTMDLTEGTNQVSLDVSNLPAARGVFTLNVKKIAKTAKGYPDYNAFQYETIVYIKPTLKPVEADIITNQPDYKPGDPVRIKLNVDGQKIENNEDVFVSVHVTDLSAYLKVPKYKLGPSIPTMVYLDKEVQRLGGTSWTKSPPEEFPYSSDYLDASFDFSTSKNQTLIEEQDRNLDGLLGVQTWRMGHISSQYKIKKVSYLSSDLRANIGLDKQNSNCNFWRFNRAFDQPFMAMGAVAQEAAAPMMMARGGPALLQKSAIFSLASTTSTTAAPQASKSQSSDSDSEQLVSYAQRPLDFMLNISESTRVYQHGRRQDWDSKVRVDLTETVFYASSLKLEKVGNDYVIDLPEFYLADQISTFRIDTAFFTSKGRYGFGHRDVKSVIPLYTKYILPSRILQGDKIQIPISLYNSRQTDQSIKYLILVRFVNETNKVVTMTSLQGAATLSAQSSKLVTQSIDTTKLTNDQEGKIFMQVAIQDNKNQIVDTLIKSVSLKLAAYKKSHETSNFLILKANQTNTSKVMNFKVPSGFMKITDVKFELNANSINSIIDVLNGLSVTPTGCFEQSASKTIPQVMGVKFLKEALQSESDNNKRDQMIKQISAFEKNIKIGYDKMTSYETKTGGYEWFGQGAGHETLTAYGLQIFSEMKKLSTIVDPSTVQRNSNWLKSRVNRTKTQIYELNKKSLDTFGRSVQPISDVYIVWTLSRQPESGFNYDTLQQDFSHLKLIADESTDPYFLSLYGLSLVNVGKSELADPYARKMMSMQVSDGSIKGASSSITNSRGKDLVIETTALVGKLWLYVPGIDEYQKQCEKIAEFLKTSIKPRSYLSTQAKVLGLDFLSDYLKKIGRAPSNAAISLYLNNKEVKTFQITPRLRIGNNNYDFTQALKQDLQSIKAGDDINLELRMSVDKVVPQQLSLTYAFSVEYFDKDPDLNKNPQLNMKLTRTPPSPAVGQSQQVTLELTNEDRLKLPQGMAVAQLPISACTTIDMQQLEIQKDLGKINHFELSSDNSMLTVYFTDMPFQQTRKMTLSFLKKFDGSCQQLASSAYLYYNSIIRCGVM